ncbi:MAG: DUF4832 domain-containing protein [Lentisphaeria bacterium]|nr:DUF4832 domain-containing protein [Lentisphaeria bacterium]
MIESHYKVRFSEYDGYLRNPHKGCCTFQRFNGDALNVGSAWSESGPEEFPEAVTEMVGTGGHGQPVKTIPGYLPSTVSYCRWFWASIEPVEGEYDWSFIDQAFTVAEKRGQTLAVRLMSFGSMLQPQVPEWYQKKYTCEKVTVKDKIWYRPDHDSEDYFRLWGRVIQAFADRYDDDERLETIDIAFIGPWGEGNGTCSKAQVDRFVSLWTTAFKQTPCLALVEGYQLNAGIKANTGWRCDCFGDSAFPGSLEVPKSLSWNHHYDAYPKSICQSGAQDTWKHAPVHFETCWVPKTWKEQGANLDFIIQQGLKFHGTYFMPKSTELPQEWMKKLADFCERLGYRFVLRQVRLPRFLSRQKFVFEAWIENTGVAPIYRKYDLALRFRQESEDFIVPVKNVDIKTWLPGDIWIEQVIELPPKLTAGICEISIAIVDKNRNPKVKFAIKEIFKDNWHPLGISIVE